MNICFSQLLSELLLKKIQNGFTSISPILIEYLLHAECHAEHHEKVTGIKVTSVMLVI